MNIKNFDKFRSKLSEETLQQLNHLILLRFAKIGGDDSLSANLMNVSDVQKELERQTIIANTYSGINKMLTVLEHPYTYDPAYTAIEAGEMDKVDELYEILMVPSIIASLPDYLHETKVPRSKRIGFFEVVLKDTIEFVENIEPTVESEANLEAMKAIQELFDTVMN